MQQDIESSNQAFEYFNPHQKHLEVNISQYSYGNIIIFFIFIFFKLKKKRHCAGIMLDAPTIG